MCSLLLVSCRSVYVNRQEAVFKENNAYLPHLTTWEVPVDFFRFLKRPLLGVMSVCPANQDHQRDASGVYNEVSFGAKLASVRGVGARFMAPRVLDT